MTERRINMSTLQPSLKSNNEIEIVGDQEEQGLLEGFSKPTVYRKRIRPRLPPPFKTSLAALSLLIIGFFFLVLSVVSYFDASYQHEHTLGYLGLGLVMFIPGSYSSYILYGSWMGWRDFDYSMVPSYDE